MTRALEQLIEKWREESVRHPQRNSGPEHAWGEAHDKCADELEAALALPGEPQEPHTHVFSSFEVCNRCGLTEAAIEGCHHCTDSDSIQNGRCWWCLRPLPGGRESKEEPVLTAEQVLAEVERQERAQTAQEEK